MKRQYFFDLATRRYVGCNNSGQACQEGCGVTNKEPENSDMLFAADTDMWVDQSEDSKTVSTKKITVTTYHEKVSGFTIRQINAALMRAKCEKRRVLLAEKALRDAGE